MHCLAVSLQILRSIMYSVFNLHISDLDESYHCDLVREIDPGYYYHFGFVYHITKLLDKVQENVSELLVQIGIDGLPLFKSSPGEFWPILGCIMNIKSLQKFIFPVGIYYGLKKPTTSSSFLDEFVTEAVDLSANGFLYKGKTILLKINSFVCDAPAKSFILGIKGHAGYASCTRCHQHGTRFDNRTTFPQTNGLPRSHVLRMLDCLSTMLSCRVNGN
uniref:Transposase domain-containing protein n=1 Tax=Cacopsylla melanoneura TaxID=428564 RepID=A0A8D8XD08_9HEMI